MNKKLNEKNYSGDEKKIKDEDLEENLNSLKRLAHWLDECIKVPGTEWKIGVDGIVGLIPIVGDITTGCLSAYIIYQARKFNIPKKTLLKMIWNATLDIGIGFIPILGDQFDLYWKANLANVKLVISHIENEIANHKIDGSSS